jgi:hypothetical protein
MVAIYTLIATLGLLSFVAPAGMVVFRACQGSRDKLNSNVRPLDQKLQRNFNNIHVRIFVLSGAPNFHDSRQNCEHRVCAHSIDPMPFYLASYSRHSQCAVENQCLTRDRSGLCASEIAYCSSDFFSVCKPMQWNAREHRTHVIRVCRPYGSRW